MSGGGQANVPKDGDVVAWLKREGDHVDKDEELCELETDKAVETIIAPVSGILVDIAYPVERRKPWIRGEMVLPLGDPIFYDPPFCWIETDEVVVAPAVPELLPDEVVVEAILPQLPPDNVFGQRKRASVLRAAYREPENAKPRMTMEALRLMQEEKISHEELFNFFQGKIPLFTEYHMKRLLEKRDADIQSQHDVAVMSDLAQKGSVRAVPLARTIAREKGVDLAHVQGTGPDGIILPHDVEKKVGAQGPEKRLP